MAKTIVSDDGRFEWEQDKEQINIAKHGFSFSEILEVLNARKGDKNDKEAYDDYVKKTIG